MSSDEELMDCTLIIPGERQAADAAGQGLVPEKKAFIAALRSFIARRGRCLQIPWYYGTNFVGAARELAQMLQQCAGVEGTEFVFNPLAAPHFGGIWERPIDLDDILPDVGEFGKYQKLMVWLVCLPACIPCGFCAFNQLFMSDVPEDYWCKVPKLGNLTEEELKRIAIPMHNGSYSKCERYAHNWSGIVDLTMLEPNETWPVEGCMDGWSYSQNNSISSIVVDFDLVCDKDIYPTLGLTALNTGGPVGVYFFGLLNDRIGRRKSFFLCLFTLLTGSALTACARDFWWWAGSRVIVGLTLPAIYQIPFIISLELVGPNYRSFVTVMTCTFYTFGLMALALMAYLIRNWVHLALATSMPFFSYVVYWFFLPESPRWLLAKGRFEEALKILEVLAKVNKKVLPAAFKENIRQRIAVSKPAKQECPDIFALCRTPNMRLKTILITLNWFANTTVYIGLSYYGPALGSNPYLSFLLSSAVEVPSYLICWVLMDRWGRRWPLCLSMIISGVSCIATMLLPTDAVTATLVLYLISKSAISASFLIIYPFAGELYPTQLRGLGIGTSAYIGGLGLIIIPFITYLGSENLVLPLIIMGSVSVLGGIFGLRLPETLHHKLPQTLEEGEEFGKNFTMEDCLRCIPVKRNPFTKILRHRGALFYGAIEGPIVVRCNSGVKGFANAIETQGISREMARAETSPSCSFENMELAPVKEEISEETPLNKDLVRRYSMRRLNRQSSFMDQKDYDGTIKITYWM